MTVSRVKASHLEESDADRRRGILDENALTVNLVSALAGDRPLTEAEKHRLDELKKFSAGTAVKSSRSSCP